jgi:phage shock protein A
VRILGRLKNIIKARIGNSLDAWEEPRQMLDYSITKMEENLHDITKKALEVATIKKKLERQYDLYLLNIKKYEELAQKALSTGNEDLAREIIEKKVTEEERATGISEQIQILDKKLQEIVKAQKQMQYNLESLHIKKEELKATYEASQAQIKVKEIMTSLGKDYEDVGKIIARAEKKIKYNEAKVLAFEELMENGVVQEILPKKDDVINSLNMGMIIEQELDKLKKNLEKKE